MNIKDWTLKDWAQLIVAIGIAAVLYYRVGALETRFDKFDQSQAKLAEQFVRKDVFDLRMQITDLKIETLKQEVHPK